MKVKYIYEVKSLEPRDELVRALIEIKGESDSECLLDLSIPSIYTHVFIDKKDNATIDDYTSLAIIKAKEIILKLANEAA